MDLCLRRCGPKSALSNLKIRRALTIAVCLLVSDPALAGPPFVTDDPEVPPPRGWVPFILERTPGRTDLDAPLLDLNYGLPDLQLSAEIPIAVASKDHGRTAASLGDFFFGVTWPFLA